MWNQNNSGGGGRFHLRRAFTNLNGIAIFAYIFIEGQYRVRSVKVCCYGFLLDIALQCCNFFLILVTFCHDY